MVYLWANVDKFHLVDEMWTIGNLIHIQSTTSILRPITDSGGCPHIHTPYYYY